VSNEKKTQLINREEKRWEGKENDKKKYKVLNKIKAEKSYV
jgi:hypothetical protein